MVIEADQVKVLEGYVKGKKLHEQLEASGAYEKVRNRRGAQLLRAYLPTQLSAAEANQTLEEPYKSPGTIISYTMRQVFPFLDEQTQQEYGTAEAAIRPRTQVGQLEGFRRTIQSYREGTYTGKPLGGARPGTGGRREPGDGKKLGRPPGSGSRRR